MHSSSTLLMSNGILTACLQRSSTAGAKEVQKALKGDEARGQYFPLVSVEVLPTLNMLDAVQLQYCCSCFRNFNLLHKSGVNHMSKTVYCAHQGWGPEQST